MPTTGSVNIYDESVLRTRNNAKHIIPDSAEVQRSSTKNSPYPMPHQAPQVPQEPAVQPEHLPERKEPASLLYDIA